MSLRAGDYAFNLKTGEAKLIIEIDTQTQMVTFSGEQKWRSIKGWVGNVRLGR